MNVLTRARGVRFRLMLKAGLQCMLAAGLAIAALSVSSSDGALSLIFCLALAGLFGFLSVKTLRLRASFKPQAAAEHVLRDLVPRFTEKGWVVARQRKLPAECRGYLVMYPPTGELGFVVGLSGDWPDRGFIENPQRVAPDISQYWYSPVPICLAALWTGYRHCYTSRVHTPSPTPVLAQPAGTAPC